MIWRIAAGVCLLWFYGVYLGKLVCQRRKGIRTDQLARNKRGSGFWVELLLKLTTYAVALFQAMALFLPRTALSWGLCLAGLVLAVLGCLLFTASVVTMRDQWRAGIAEEATALVTGGIYRWSRNPAFLGFYLWYAGYALMQFRWPLLLASLAAVVLLHLQILREERHLLASFGPAYRNYCGQTLRYLGRRRKTMSSGHGVRKQ